MWYSPLKARMPKYFLPFDDTGSAIKINEDERRREICFHVKIARGMNFFYFYFRVVLFNFAESYVVKSNNNALHFE